LLGNYRCTAPLVRNMCIGYSVTGSLLALHLDFRRFNSVLRRNSSEPTSNTSFIVYCIMGKLGAEHLPNSGVACRLCVLICCTTSPVLKTFTREESVIMERTKEHAEQVSEAGTRLTCNLKIKSEVAPVLS